MNCSDVGEGIMLSVIIPAYNVEATLAEALDSVLAQTLESLEIILVEDGSTDSTPRIVEQYSQHPKVRTIYHDENRGLPAARNTAIEAARGRYIGFVDGDDTADQLMYETMVGAAEVHHAEVVTCGYSTVSLSGGDSPTPQPLRFPPDKLFAGKALNELLRRGHRDRLYWFNPCFIYSRELLSREAIRFDENLRLGVDTPFNAQALRKATCVYGVGDHLYRVRQRQGSMTQAGNRAWNERVNDQYLALRRFYEEESIWQDVALDYHSYVLQVGIPQAVK